MRQVSFRYPTYTRRLVTLLCRLVYKNRFPVYFQGEYIVFGNFPNDVYFTKREILAAYYLEKSYHISSEISTYLLNVYISAIQWKMEEDKRWKRTR